MFRRLTLALLLRRLAHDHRALVAQLEQQTALLARLVDHLAPVPVPPDRATLREASGVSHLDPDEASHALAYIDRTVRATGHTPDDEEVRLHLDDEATRDLGERLSAREAQLARLARSQHE